MQSTYHGDKLELTIYGQSHSETIGVYIKGLPEGVKPDEEFVKEFMARRAPERMPGPLPEKKLTKSTSIPKTECFTDSFTTRTPSPRITLR